MLYHNNGDGTFTDVSEKAGVAGLGQPLGRRLLFPRLRPRRPARPVRRQLPELRSGRGAAARGFRLLPLQRDSGALRSARVCRRNEHPVPQSRRRHVRRCVRAVGHSPAARPFGDGVRQRATGDRSARTAWARRRQISTTTAGPTSTSPATPHQASSIATTMTARSVRSACRRVRRSMNTASLSPAWAWASATTTPTAGSTSSGPTSPSS